MGYTYDQCNIISDWFVGKYGLDFYGAIAELGKNLTHDGTAMPSIKLDGLLRWHNNSIFLTEDLMTCVHLAYNRRPQNIFFNWNPFLRTDSKYLEELFGKPLSDVHSHLKGSSLNFDVNWICLMNHISNRQKAFAEFCNQKQSQIFIHSSGIYSLYAKAIMAASIRLFLFGEARNQKIITGRFVKRVITSQSLLESLSYASELQSILDATRTMCAIQYTSEDGVRKASIDYAVYNGINLVPAEKCPYSVLAGERFIMYSTLFHITANNPKPDLLSSLFYIYLLIKNEIRCELIQANDSVGFDNFNIYERRKTIFIDGYPLYEELLVRISLASFFENRTHGSTHETRIAPKPEYTKCLYSLIETEHNIASTLFGIPLRVKAFGYDYHFIKKQDKTDCALMSLYERHHDLRKEVKQESLNIYRIRNGFIQMHEQYIANRVVGIDAANSEILCRPEVFAQAFRFLRGHKVEHPEINALKDLGITYHVGEDFVDVVDGLRAVDELLHYMNYRRGDRLGHALVLGVDVAEYYTKRKYSICMSRQMFLDNVAWLNRMLNVYEGYREIAKMLVKIFNDQFDYIYKDSNLKRPSINTYYDSWLLRGDNPEMYLPDGCIDATHLGDWNECALNTGLDIVRKSKTCCRLYYMYHYCESVKLNGNHIINIQDVIGNEWADQFIRAIAFVQQIMLKQIHCKGICIECNPTSNFKIGEIDRYDQHPIQQFYPYLKSKKGVSISSSINTDDKGIFATNIEREYALIYAAFHRKNQRESSIKRSRKRDIDQWVDDIREFSNKQSFVLIKS